MSTEDVPPNGLPAPPPEPEKDPVQLCWHGTPDAETAEIILREGFTEWTYFARHLEDALAFGGPHVFTVAFHPLNSDTGWWQFRAPERVPPECIAEYKVYDVDVRLDRRRPERSYERFDHSAAYDRAFPPPKAAEQSVGPRLPALHRFPDRVSTVLAMEDAHLQVRSALWGPIHRHPDPHGDGSAPEGEYLQIYEGLHEWVAVRCDDFSQWRDDPGWVGDVVAWGWLEGDIKVPEPPGEWDKPQWLGPPSRTDGRLVTCDGDFSWNEKRTEQG